jgi:hypothetical protein
MWPLLLLATLAPVSAEALPVQIWDRTGVSLPLIEEVFSPAELAGAGSVTIAWAESYDLPSAMVPYNSSSFPECANIDGVTFPERCVLVDADWWPEAGGYAPMEPTLTEYRRALLAHEFAHVLSLERKDVDRTYGYAVNRVDEECLADKVAAHVLVRAGYLPPAVHYQCTDFWFQAYGEDRSYEAGALALDLLRWAAERGTPESESVTESPSAAATATVQATRLPSTEG